MKREKLEAYIAETYGVQADYPWVTAPNYMVFRHGGNRKWFAVVMDIPPKKLGLPKDGMMDIVNVKCSPMMIGSFREEPGIYPAYHLNKDNWLTVALDGSVDDGKIKLLLDMSFSLTAPKVKKRKSQS